MTTDRIPTGYPLLDALLGGGLRAGTLTVIARGSGVDETRSAGAICAALEGHLTAGSPDFTVYPSGSGVPVDRAKHAAREDKNVLVVVRSLAAGEALTTDADVLIRVTGKAYQLRVDVAKHRGGNTGSLVFTLANGVLTENGVCRWDDPRPPDPVAVERARWFDAMGDLAADLDRRDLACQQQKDATRLDRDAEVLHAKATTYAHAAEMLRAELARMTGTT